MSGNPSGGKTRRKNEAAIYTAIMCFMVIFIHVTSEAVNGYLKDSALYAVAFIANRLCSFVVPGFIFVSALKYFMSFTTPTATEGTAKSFNYGKFLTSRLLKVYIPYLIWVVIYYVYFFLEGYFPNFSITELARYVFVGDLVAHMYFVVIIMQFYILMPVWRALIKTNRAQAATVLVACLLITYFVRFQFIGYQYNDRIFTSYLIYWVVGAYCGMYYSDFLSLLSKYRKYVYLIYAALTAAHLGFSYLHSTGAVNYRFAEHVHIIFCMVSLIFVYDICILLSKKLGKLQPIFGAISDASYYIYLSHVLAILIAEKIMRYNFGISSRLLAKSALAFTVPVILSILYVYLKKRFLPKKTK